jgi:aryl-alcohol dehydrogenase-like predicted oxidoreductase
MNYRIYGKTDWKISEVGFGAWAIGGSWGEVKDDESIAALREAISQGMNFIDTADVYGDGRSEKLIAQILRDFKGDKIYVVTKAGRRLNPHVTSGYNYANLSQFIDRSLQNLETDSLDLVQLHCPPTDVYQRQEAFVALDKIKQEGKIQHYGVSVETVEEAKMALKHPGVASVQIIFNMFRLKPSDEFFALAKEANVGILARVPLASGLLSGKMTKDSTFAKDDHRNFNRHGEAFDVGETFSGVDFETGLKAVEELKALVPDGYSMTQLALRWILMHPAISTVIPGAKNPQQAKDNALASDMPMLTPAVMQKTREVYDRYIRQAIHNRW